MKEIIEIPKKDNAIVTRESVEALKRQRELLYEFVSSQLTEAKFDDFKSPSYGKGDYGIIPGTKQRCLFKQGAEKFQKLFKLGLRFELTDKVIDRDANFAMFTYRAEIYELSIGTVIASCEGSANSQEKKFKERSVWKTVKGKKVKEVEETPIFDILNNLQKMAQKRANVGATISATGASEYFTQDILEPEDIAEQVTQAPKGEPSDFGAFEVPFGRAKGKRIDELTEQELESAADWLGKMDGDPKGAAREMLEALEGFTGQRIR